VFKNVFKKFSFGDFFSFGTNDLTQTILGFSRDDAEAKFIPQYIEKKILAHNPFAVLDRAGVDKLVKMACELGRSANPKIKLGICSAHGGDPSSIEFCHLTGLTYVSCSPFPGAGGQDGGSPSRHPEDWRSVVIYLEHKAGGLMNHN